ncbi:unnamed protein product [Phytophthora lilii]|uniref:Unnamed protein product n=1 Tax=Phytophthora lilii TaxID=2077276 RepID=A0A9W6U3M4_9STRA|nr:unnamed protein product [Phytophthora lilii]
MQAIQEPIEDTGDNDGGVDLPCQSEEDRRWQLHVGDVVQIVQGHSEKRTYALYFGQGRVIHAWTPSRQSFRVRVDSLRGLQLSGYTANIFSRDFDAFILQLLKLAPLASAEVIRRAKMALHATTSSRVSSLSLILFARYGDSIPVLLQSLKKAYQVALSKWMFGSSAVSTGRRYLEGLQCCESPLDDPVRLSGHKSDVDEDAASSGSFIKLFLGTNGEHLLSEWLGRSLADFFNASATKNPWYAILMPPATNHFSKSRSTCRYVSEGWLTQVSIPHSTTVPAVR